MQNREFASRSAKPSPEKALEELCRLCPSLRSAVRMLTATDEIRSLRRVARHRAHTALAIIGEVTDTPPEILSAATVQVERLFVRHYPGWQEW